MNKILKEAFRVELDRGRLYFAGRELDAAFYHFERAHILGQSYVIPHTVSHCWMLRIGVARRDVREIFGQITRILASLVISRVWVPIGNTGGANVSPIRPMAVPADLAEILRATGRRDEWMATVGSSRRR